MSREILTKAIVVATFAVVASAAGVASYQVGVGSHAGRQSGAPLTTLPVRPADPAARVDAELFVPAVTRGVVAEPKIVILKTKPADPPAEVDAELFAPLTTSPTTVFEAKAFDRAASAEPSVAR
jgi:hypothetical protein